MTHYKRYDVYRSKKSGKLMIVPERKIFEEIQLTKVLKKEFSDVVFYQSTENKERIAGDSFPKLVDETLNKDGYLIVEESQYLK